MNESETRLFPNINFLPTSRKNETFITRLEQRKFLPKSPHDENPQSAISLLTFFNQCSTTKH